MAKLRSVSTSTWSDPWFEELSVEHKLIFLYLLTNEKTNMLGIYEASARKIAFETGVDSKTVKSVLSDFEEFGKVSYSENYVIMINFLKHQNFNVNMKKGAIDSYNSLPKSFGFKKLNISKESPIEGFETLSNHLGILSKREYNTNVNTNVNIEYEEESKTVANARNILEDKKELFKNFWDLYDKKTSKETVLKKWLKLSQEEMKQVFIHLPKYVDSTPDKSFRKNPLTYLNQKSFNDEIITKTTAGTNTDSVSTRYRKAWEANNEGGIEYADTSQL